MQRVDRSVIDKIIAVRPFLYGWQDEIEKEQGKVLADISSPAKKTVEALIALDNRRIDLCNLKVLYAYIERELGSSFSSFVECSKCGIASPMYETAANAMKLAGYDTARARLEFGYLFKRLKTRKKTAIAAAVASVFSGSSSSVEGS